MRIIRFPPYVDLRKGKPPMARLKWWWQRLFKKPPANVARLRIQRARRGQTTIRHDYGDLVS
jgi:hypothetical protein